MGEIAGYILRRMALALPVLLGATLIAFLLGVAAPGDPAREALSQSGFGEPTLEEIEALRERLGLNRPLPEQYFAWLGNLLRGDLGTSLITARPISTDMLLRLPATLQLAALALTMATLLGIGGGLLMGYFRRRWIDHAGRILTVLILSMPGFWLALLLILVLAEHLRWLPTSGYGTFRHLVLPAFVLATGTMAVLMRLGRAVMIDTMNQPHILTARAKGLSEFSVVVGHALRNTLVPLVTILGSYFGAILGGSVIIEVIFAIPGIGRYAIEAIFRRDYPVIQAYVVMTAAIFVVFNLLTDLLCLWIHPAIRLSGGAR